MDRMQPKKNPLRSTNKTYIPENPFDIIDGPFIPAIETPESHSPSGLSSNILNECPNTPEKPSEHSATEDLFMKLLQNPKAVPSLSDHVSGIFKGLKILSDSELSLAPKRYYRFPFSESTVNDQSQTYKTISEYFVQALHSVYSNYRTYKKNFIIKINDELIFFDEQVTCSKGLKTHLCSNDISFSENLQSPSVYFIADRDVPLLYDFVMNVKVLPGMSLPFILSENEFENALIYSTRVKKGPVVRVGSQNEHLYIIKGPLYSLDYKIDKTQNIKYTYLE